MKIYILFFSFIFLTLPRHDNIVKLSNEKPELIYVYDPLCGWCYGFSPVMMKLKKEYGESVKFTVISGGMIIDEREGPLSEKAAFIKWAYKNVEEGSGIKFGEAFLKGPLEDGKMFFSSMPPSLALTVFKSLHEEKSVEFAGAIQKMIYYEGKDLNAVSSYTALLKDFNIDSAEFVKRFSDSAYKEKTINDFKYSNSLGVTGFPTVFFKKGEKIQLITRGYDSYDKVERKLKSYLH
ncbi:MAG: DsbA family protein [Cytophagaceae bacterium]|nr:DsbA family protein [Cytophagaceae bacterium]